jgi:hypothetical protein
VRSQQENRGGHVVERDLRVRRLMGGRSRAAGVGSILMPLGGTLDRGGRPQEGLTLK